jgi:hypothetical protein
MGKAFSVFGLAGEFRQEIGTLVKDEVQLAKVELGEKIALIKRNAINLGIGTFVGFAGLVLVSLAVGKLLALVFEGWGWSEALSNFVGITTAGLLIALVGLVFLLKAVKTLSASSLKPERTIETLRELRGNQESSPPLKEPKALQPTKEELEARIDHTRAELKHTMHKARKRIAWASAATVLGRQVRRHPVRMLVIGAGAGLARRMIRRRRTKHMSMACKGF